MKKLGRVLSILIMTLMIATPTMSFATEEGSFGASGNGRVLTTDGDEASETDSTGGGTESASIDGTETAAQDTDKEPPDETGGEDKKASDEEAVKLPDEPTEVIIVDSVEELSEVSDAEYGNDAFFTIDAAKDDSADLATEAVSEDVTEILSGDGSASKKKEEIIDALEDSGLYHAEGSGKSKVEVTSKFAYQRLKLVAPHEEEINAYGAIKAVYFEDSYLLSYDSMESAMLAYDALASEYGEDSVFIDSPMKLRSNEKGWGTAFMRMDYHKTLAENSGEVTVAVIDTGIMKSHPVFSEKSVLQGKDFINNDDDPADDNGHGTAVSGVIAESTPSNVRIMPLKAMDSKGEGSETDVINAIRYANENGADIINMSIGGYLNNEAELAYYESKFRDYDALIVCAAGNENRNMDAADVVEFPGELSFTICVGSITAGKDHSSFSNYGKAVDFSAPGNGVQVAALNGSYRLDSGTSFSSPYVSSAAALMKAGHTGYSNQQIINSLNDISEDLGDPGKDIYFGNGCPRFSQNPDHQRGGDISDLGDTTTVTDVKNKTYTGSAQVQKPSVITNGEILEQGIDFDIQYQNNVNAGTAKMTIIGKGDYTGQIEGLTFTIYPKTITPTVTLSGSSFTYTGKEIKPKVSVRDGSKNLTSGTDYTVSYSNNVNAGTGYATVTCRGNYNGSSVASFRITSNKPSSANYTLTAVSTRGTSPTTAEFTWKMDRPLSNGDKIDINGQKIVPRDTGNGTYSWTLTHFDPAKSYKIPVKVIDKNGRTISNVTYHYLGRYYTVTAVSTRGTSPTTAEFTWKMSHPVTDGAKVDINGQKIVPRNNGNGTYSWELVHFDPAKSYKIPVKVIDKNGRVISNVTYHYLGRYYTVTAVSTRGTSPTTAEFTWKMSHPVTDGAKVDINGQKIVPRNNGNGTYSWELVHFDPAKSYKIPVKVIDKNGRVISNVTYHYLGRYYTVTAVSTRSTSPTTAKFIWKMSHPVTDGAKVDINGQKIVPRNNGNGTYSWELAHFDPAKSYKIPVKVIDKNGRTVSNVIYAAVSKYTPIPVKSISISGPQYLAAGRVYKLTATVNADASNKNLSWYADNTSAATVDNSGRVTAVGNGTATIYVKALDGSGTKASYKIYSHKYTRDETKWIAHRGLHTKETENTAAAFIAAGENGGFWGCECDIFETKHDEGSFDIVINHDASYKRVFGVDKKVNEVTADEIRSATGSLRNVCFLEDYLAICKRYNMVPVIEFKGELGFTDAGIEKTIKMVDEAGLLDDAYFVSFNADILDRVQTYVENNYEAQPFFGYLLDGNDVITGIDLAKKKGFSGINLAYPKLTPEADKKCIDNKLELGTWTYGSDTSIKYLYEHITSGKYHVMSATTDYPFFN